MVFISDNSGRFLTNYTSSCKQYEDLKKEYGFQSDYQFRLFMQRHGQDSAV